MATRRPHVPTVRQVETVLRAAHRNRHWSRRIAFFVDHTERRHSSWYTVLDEGTAVGSRPSGVPGDDDDRSWTIVTTPPPNQPYENAHRDAVDVVSELRTAVSMRRRAFKESRGIPSNQAIAKFLRGLLDAHRDRREEGKDEVLEAAESMSLVARDRRFGLVLTPEGESWLASHSTSKRSRAAIDRSKPMYRMEPGYALAYSKRDGWEDVMLTDADVKRARFQRFQEVDGNRVGIFKLGRKTLAQLAQNLERIGGTPRGVGARKSTRRPRLGSGKRFAELSCSLRRRGVRDPDALAATIGRRKYGPAKMAKMASAGRRRRRVGADNPFVSELRDMKRSIDWIRSDGGKLKTPSDYRFELTRVRLRGDYTSGGSYRGTGAPLYILTEHDSGRTHEIRAADRSAAMALVRSVFPKAKFGQR